MEISDVLYLFHYSRNLPYSCNLLAIDSNIIRLGLIKKDEIVNFKENDPAVMYYLENQNIGIIGLDITTIDNRNNELIIKLDDDESRIWEEKRDYVRYPVSLCIDIRANSMSKKRLALVKNLSYSGMLIYSEVEIDFEGEFEVVLYTEKQVMFLKARTMRTEKHPSFIEYGFQIVYSNYTSMDAMKQYVASIKEAQLITIRKLAHLLVK